MGFRFPGPEHYRIWQSKSLGVQSKEFHQWWPLRPSLPQSPDVCSGCTLMVGIDLTWQLATTSEFYIFYALSTYNCAFCYPHHQKSWDFLLRDWPWHLSSPRTLSLFHFMDLKPSTVPGWWEQPGTHSVMKLLTQYYDRLKHNTIYIMPDIKKNVLEVIKKNCLAIIIGRIIYCFNVLFLANGCCVL